MVFGLCEETGFLEGLALSKNVVLCTSVLTKTTLILKYIKKRFGPLFPKLKYLLARHRNTTVFEYFVFRNTALPN